MLQTRPVLPSFGKTHYLHFYSFRENQVLSRDSDRKTCNETLTPGRFKIGFRQIQLTVVLFALRSQ